MQIHQAKYELTVLLAVALVGLLPLQAQEKESVPTAPVRMTVTAQLLGENKRMPEIKREDVMVKQGSDRLQVTGWTPAQGDHAGLDLFFLIDDALDPSIGQNLNDVRAFINAQPATTSVGVGYMRNATVQIAQNFTTDHDQAAKALRLPQANVGAFGSPYLSLIDLMKRWPQDTNRREVVMITDGIDRARGGPRRGVGALTPIPDVSTAGDLAQRTGTIVHTMYARGAGRLGRNYWQEQNGINGTSQLSDVSGGASFFLSFQNMVSFKPWLDDLQTILDNQYILGFGAIPGRRAGLQRINLTTEVAGVEFAAADSVWVPGS